MAAAVVHRVLQLPHQRAVIQEAGELVPEEHLPQAAAPLRPGDHRLQQQLRGRGVGQEVVGAGAKGLDLRGRVRRSDHQRRQQVEPRVLPHVTQHAEAVAVGQARRGGQQIRNLAVQQLPRRPWRTDCAPRGCSPAPARRRSGWSDPHRRRAGARWRAAGHSGPGCARSAGRSATIRSAGNTASTPAATARSRSTALSVSIRITARGRVERRLVHEEATAEGSPSPGAVPITRRSTRWSPVTVSGSSLRPRRSTANPAPTSASVTRSRSAPAREDQDRAQAGARLPRCRRPPALARR